MIRRKDLFIAPRAATARRRRKGRSGDYGKLTAHALPSCVDENIGTLCGMLIREQRALLLDR